jgi:hypothetical protein
MDQMTPWSCTGWPQMPDLLLVLGRATSSPSPRPTGQCERLGHQNGSLSTGCREGKALKDANKKPLSTSQPSLPAWGLAYPPSIPLAPPPRPVIGPVVDSP